MSESVAQKTARTSLWSGVERFANLGVNFIVQLILARMLMPSDFGVVAMMTVFIGICQAISESGITNALIRKQDCNQRDFSTAFYVSFALSIILYFILFHVAPLIAQFYKMPLITALLRVYALVFFFEALRIVQYARLCKRLEFKIIAKISSISVFVSGIIGLLTAYAGMGAWALIGQLLSASIIYFIMITIHERWIPDRCFDKQAFRYLWGFGSKMLLTGIISRIYGNIYSLVIGRYYNPTILGYFNNGQRYGQFYPYLVESVFARNSLPIFAEYQSNRVQLSNIYRKYIRLVSLLTFPACLLLVLLARPLVVILLTEKWLGVVPYLQLFAVAALLVPANTINLNILQAMGRTDLTLIAEIVKKSIGFVFVFFLVQFGPMWLAVGSGIMALFAYCVNAYCAKIVLKLSIITQIKDVLDIFLSSMATAIFVYFLNISSSFLCIIVNSLIYFIIYFALIKYVVKEELVNQISVMLKKLNYRR